jgi:hypothetical protein
MISDLIQIQILHTSQCFDHNFLLKYRIEMIQMAVESSFKIIQVIVKYNFPNSEVYFVKIVPQYKNTNLSESYPDFRLLIGQGD